MARLHIAAALFLAVAAVASASALPRGVVRQEATDAPETTVPATTAPGTAAPEAGASTVVADPAGTTAAGAPVEGAPVEGAPVEDAPVEDAPVAGAPVAGAPKADASTEPEDDEEEASAEPTGDDDDDGVCFPGDATVELQSGEVVPMSAVSIGDRVKVGAGEYSTVFMFTHKLHDVAYEYVTLRTASGATLSLTKGHYLYANGALVAAASVAEGDVLTLGDGASSPVVHVGTRSGHGLFNPQTLHGDVVVNGVVSSTYTTAVAPGFAHAVLAPLRALSGAGLRFTGLESGAQTFVGVVPGAKVEL